MILYIAKHRTILMRHDPSNEVTPVATCRTESDASVAAALMDRAAKAQDKRHYTASARLYHQAECVQGFSWIELKEAAPTGRKEE